MKTKHLLLAIGLLCLGTLANAEGFLKADGKKIVDEKGNTILLRGMGLGGWMLQEGYMLRMPGSGTQHSIKARITNLIGQQECDRFYDLWLKNHMTRRDVDLMAQWGFNSIRLPMHYNLFTLPIDQEKDSTKSTWIEKGFAMTDSLLAWCKANNMYLILDLHAAPGGQGNDTNISDRDESKPSIWQNEQNKKKTIALWRKLAEHYANEPYIGGYDLLNEPNWTFEGKHKNGTEDQANTALWKLYDDIIKAIREVDKRHIVIIEGNGWGNNYNGFTKPFDSNMVFSFHKYWNANNTSDIQRFLNLRDKYNVPLWLGESGENSNKWFRDCIALVEANGIGWSWWPLKKITGINNPLTIKAPEGYEKLLTYWRTQQAPKPDAAEASRILFQLIENLKADNCDYHKEVIDAMFRQVSDSSTQAYAKNSIPGRIFASNFDLGIAGRAYSDKESERIDGKAGLNGGNKRGAFRNDGVDIEINKDSLDQSARYAITSIEKDEWLKYTVQVHQGGKFRFEMRTLAPGTESAGFTLLMDGKKALQGVLTAEAHPLWKTSSFGTISLSKGKHVLQLIANNGGWKFSYLDFKK